MMKYAVIVCPSCGKARGIETARKTSTCQCGRKIVNSRVKRHFLTDSPTELASAVGEANAALAGGGKLPRRKARRRTNPYSEIAERAKRIKDRTQRLSQIAQELTEHGQEFSLEDLRKVAALVGKEPGDEMLSLMVSQNIVYMVGDERYRAV